MAAQHDSDLVHQADSVMLEVCGTIGNCKGSAVANEIGSDRPQSKTADDDLNITADFYHPPSKDGGQFIVRKPVAGVPSCGSGGSKSFKLSNNRSAGGLHKASLQPKTQSNPYANKVKTRPSVNVGSKLLILCGCWRHCGHSNLWAVAANTGYACPV